MKGSRLVLFGIIAIVAAVASGMAWAMTSIPPIEEQIPGSPVSVQIVYPLNGEFFDSQSTIPIQVYATSQNNVISVEIWDNGQLLDTQAVSQQFPLAIKTSYPWNFPATGVHVLMARAKDAQGYTGQSSVALVTIKTVTPLVEFTTSAGDTLKSVAEFLEMDEEEIAAVNPGLEPGAPLGDGQIVQLPPPAEAPPSPPQEGPPTLGEPPQDPTYPPNPIIYKLKELTKLGGTPAAPPFSPKLWGSIENCNQVKLTIVPQSDDEDGFFVYRWVFDFQQDLAFTKIAVLGPVGSAQKPVEYTDTLSGLAAYYYVSAFNALGESSSAPIAVKYDESCLTGGQTEQIGELLEVKTEFETTEPVDNGYCYYSTTPGEWKRLPSQEFEFFKPGKDNFGLNMMIVDPPPVLVMECWGWGGGTIGNFSLSYLGKAEVQMSAEPVTLVGENFSFSLPPLPMLNTKPGDGQSEGVQMSNVFTNLASKKVPSPINLREAEDAFVCDNHIDVGKGCQQLMDKQIKEEYLLIWDWVEGTCWGSGEDCPWLSVEDAYPKFNLYMVNNPSPLSSTYDTGIVTPLAWGGNQCFYVTASVDTVIGQIESAPSNTYCPNQKNPPKVMVLKPTNLITQRQTSLYQCVMPPTDPAAGLSAGQMMVGVYDTACWDQKFQGAVMFDLTQFYNQVNGFSLQKATLKFEKGSTIFKDFASGYEEATNLKPLCGLQVGWVTGTGEWASWNSATALDGGYPALTFFENPIQSLPVFGSYKSEVNVTDFVDYHKWDDWNGGFGFYTSVNVLHDQDLYHSWYTNKICLNELQNFELEIQYYPLGQ